MRSDCVLNNSLSLGAASFQLAPRIGKSKSTTPSGAVGFRMAQVRAGFAEWVWMSLGHSVAVALRAALRRAVHSWSDGKRSQDNSQQTTKKCKIHQNTLWIHTHTHMLSKVLLLSFVIFCFIFLGKSQKSRRFKLCAASTSLAWSRVLAADLAAVDVKWATKQGRKCQENVKHVEWKIWKVMNSSPIDLNCNWSMFSEHQWTLYLWLNDILWYSATFCKWMKRPSRIPLGRLKHGWTDHLLQREEGRFLLRFCHKFAIVCLCTA